MRNDFESNYLAHWGIKKGEKAKNHKYYERVEKNGRYIYFYSQAEYERWLHGAKPKVEGTAKKAKSTLSNLKNRLTKSNLINSINKGKNAAYSLATRSSTALTKSNVNSVINRGTNTISKLLGAASSKAASTANTIQRQAKSTVSNVQKQAKATTNNIQKAIKNATPKLQQKAQRVVNSVTKTLEKAGKDTQKAVQKYVSKGEKTINNVLKKAGNIKMSSTKKVQGVGTTIIASLIATAIVAAVSLAVKFIKDHITEEVTVTFDDDVHTPTEESWAEEQQRREEEQRQREEERRQQELQDKGAEDKYQEDVAQHSDIPAKEEPTTKDEDMAIINEKQRELTEETNAIADEFNDVWAKYEATGDDSYYWKALELYDQYLKKCEQTEGYWNNCANCTLTYDLRRRGYDVDAPWNDTGTYNDVIYDWYKLDSRDIDHWAADSKYESMSRSDARAIVNDIKEKYPEGSYGHFMVCWGTEDKPQGGHDCVWSIEGGEVVIRDCQTNEVVDPELYILNSYDVEYFRADDKELTDRAYEIANADYVNEYGEDITSKKSKEYNKKKKKGD